MAAITISRQLGSQGDAVAHAVARNLSYRVVYRELINQAAQRAGAPEMALAMIDVLGLLDLHPSAQEAQAYQEALRHVFAEWAAQGRVVILGRAGCVLLQERPAVLHVRIVAPFRQRIEQLAQRQGISQQAARAQVEASDQARRAYVHRYHQVDWDDPQLYDLVLNTGRLTVDSAAALIYLAHSRLCPEDTVLLQAESGVRS
jgi:CMP/dCMP kinase